jgi:hypothetical protein
VLGGHVLHPVEPELPSALESIVTLGLQTPMLAFAHLIGSDEKRTLGEELLQVMHRRLGEAKPDDLAQMAWLALRLKDYQRGSEFVRRGLVLEKDNPYLLKLAQEPDISI